MKQDADYFEVHDPVVKTILTDIGKLIGSSLPYGYGFALEICSFGEKGNIFYISNIKREDLIRSIREWANKLEKAT